MRAFHVDPFSRFAAPALAIGLFAAPAAAVLGPNAINPAYSIATLGLPEQYHAMGIGFLSDGRMVLLTTGIIGGGEIPNPDANSAVYLVKGVTGGGGTVQVQKIASMFRQPSGVNVVNDKIYVSDRDAFYSIPSNNVPADPSTNKAKVLDWPAGAKWHQWVFTPIYKAGKFYAPYSGSIRVGGPSDVPASSEWSGAFLSWDPDGKNLTKFAGGLRSPNGAGMNDAGDMFVMDNQGSWLPADAFMHMKQGKFYGHRQSPPQAPNWAESLPYQPPAVWIPYPAAVAGASNSQPVYVTKGPFAGQWLAGDANGTGLLRFALEKVNGDWQGAVFRFTNGMGNSGINRMAWGPDGALYVGTMEHYGNWPGNGLMPFYKMTLNEGKEAFEMLAIHAFKDGMEIEFTRPVASGLSPSAFAVSQWHYTRGADYGCCKDAVENRTVSEVQYSQDAKRLFLKIAGLKAMDYVVSFKVTGAKPAAGTDVLWDNEAWYTINNLSTTAWNPASVGIAKGPADAGALARNLSVQPAGAGLLSIGLAAEGAYSATLRSVDGTLVSRRDGVGPDRFSLSREKRGQGIYLLEVHQGAASLSRTVAF